ncbi:MAG: substrate-binding domain-containing protein [Vitreimonas sp.]
MQPVIEPGEFEPLGGVAYRTRLGERNGLFHDGALRMPRKASIDKAARAAQGAGRRAREIVTVNDSIVEFDDTSILAAVWPPVTTIRQPVAQMAEFAVNILAAEIRVRKRKGVAEAIDGVVPHSLVLRESVAAPS